MFEKISPVFSTLINTNRSEKKQKEKGVVHIPDHGSECGHSPLSRRATTLLQRRTPEDPQLTREVLGRSDAYFREHLRT